MSKMKIKIVFYLFLVPTKWQSFLHDHLNRLKALDLYDTTRIYVVATGDSTELECLSDLLQEQYPEVIEQNFQSTNQFEFPGIKTVYEIAEDDDQTLILYFHTKGITSGQSRISDLMTKYTIDNFKMYIEAFKSNKALEVGCVIPSTFGFAYFNFFWVRSSYVRNYLNKPIVSPDFMRNDRFSWEMWLGYYNGYSRKIDINTYSPLLNDLAVQDEVGAMEVVRRLSEFEELGKSPYSADFGETIGSRYIRSRTLTDVSHGLASTKISAITDKITAHTYLPVYDEVFKPIRTTARNILEIGVWIGASLALWKNYFVNATIYAVDIHDQDFITIEDAKNCSNIKLFMPNDGYDPSFIEREFKSKNIKFDLIIDDGPHTVESQIDCINKYLPLLSENGILVIEDIASLNYLKLFLDATPEDYRKHIRMYDLRKYKGRYDDILFIIDKNHDAGQ